MSEVVALKVSDIDSGRMMIRIERARCQAETPLIVLCRFPGPALNRNQCASAQEFGRRVLGKFIGKSATASQFGFGIAFREDNAVGTLRRDLFHLIDYRLTFPTTYRPPKSLFYQHLKNHSTYISFP